MESGNPHALVTPAGTLYFNDYVNAFGQVGFLQIEKLVGADGSVVRNPMEIRPQRHGAILHPFYRGERAYTIETRLIAESLANRTDMEDWIRGFTNSLLQQDGVHTFTPSGKPERGITVRLNGEVEITDDFTATSMKRLGSGTILKNAVIPLISQDAYAHGTAETVYTIAPAATVVVNNGGNAIYWAHVDIYGPLATFTLTNNTPNPYDPLANATQVHWDGNGHTVANGDRLICQMDFETLRRASDGGSELRYVDFTVTDFFPLWPGDNSITFNSSGNGGATKAKVYAHDGWV